MGYGMRGKHKQQPTQIPMNKYKIQNDTKIANLEGINITYNKGKIEVFSLEGKEIKGCLSIVIDIAIDDIITALIKRSNNEYKQYFVSNIKIMNTNNREVLKNA